MFAHCTFAGLLLAALSPVTFAAAISVRVAPAAPAPVSAAALANAAPAPAPAPVCAAALANAALAPAPAAALVAQDPDAEVEPETYTAPDQVLVIPQWFVGDRYKLELVKQRKRTRGGEVLLDGESRTEIEVEVVGEDETSFLILWRFGEPSFSDDLPEALQPFIPKLREIATGFEVRFRTDEFGSFATVDNAEEVAAKIDGFMDALIEMAVEEAGKQADQAVVEAAAEQIRTAMSAMLDPDVMLQSAAADIAPYYMASGLGLEPGIPLSYEDELPNLFGGPNFPAGASWLAERYDPEELTATLRWTQSIDAERAAPVWRETFELLAQRTGAPAPADGAFPALQIDDAAEFEYDLEYGLAMDARVTRKVVTDEGSQVDTRIYRLLEYPEDG